MSTSSPRGDRDPLQPPNDGRAAAAPVGAPSDARANDPDARTVAYDRPDADHDGVADAREPVAVDRTNLSPSMRDEVVARERERFGGIKWGSAFFGWLAAVGVAVLLTALLAATGAAIGLGVTEEQVEQAGQDVGTVGLIGAIALLVILFVAYFAGGYVAGRMARFNGLKQGLAVWIVAIVVAIIGAIIGATAGSQYDVLANLNTFPRIPVTEGELTIAGIVTLAIVIVASLGGALLGGKAGTRFHRKVDAAGFDGDR